MSKFKRPDRNDRPTIPEGSAHPKYFIGQGQAGKGDGRGSRKSVLSEAARQQYDIIFKRKNP